MNGSPDKHDMIKLISIFLFLFSLDGESDNI